MLENQPNIEERIARGECVFERGTANFLYIPIHKLSELGGPDGVIKMHREIFGNTIPLAEVNFKSSYRIELSNLATEEQIQSFINKVNGIK